MNKLFLCLNILIISQCSSLKSSNGIPVYNSVFDVIKVNLKGNYKSVRMIGFYEGIEIYDYLSDRTVSGKKFILPGCKQMAVYNLRKGNYDIILEVYKYSIDTMAQKNYNHMKKPPIWIEKGHGFLNYFVDKYGFRISTLGSDDIIYELRDNVDESIVIWLNLLRVSGSKD